ncbi:MAG: DegT/DnrJ/EryC1/StrS family aminotransferase [Bacteroidales bacterium]|nr:DegT/DnrJ/EryC1/StrS family aminotransferase [Candidatus Colicola caccequi]
MKNNDIHENIIINPSAELVPTIHIPPISNKVLEHIEPTKEQICKCKEYLNKRFGYYCIVPKARTAIGIALDYYNLHKDDVVTILTTTGNFYISSCVTKEVEKRCLWNREITDKTKVIFVNHEFGYPYEKLADLKRYNLPIIEDCAYAFFTEDKQMGTIGDFVVYSLPKAFPMQMGGILQSTIGKITYQEDYAVREYVTNKLAIEIEHINLIRKKRLRNWHILSEQLQKINAKPLMFPKGTIPGVMLFEWENAIDYPKLKEFMQCHGVESSVFYGKPAYFIPSHQLLTLAEMNYMISLLQYWANNY